MKGIVVTGATSMLGVSLIEECLAKNVRVLAIAHRNSSKLDRLPHSDLIEIKQCNLDELDRLQVDEESKNRYEVFYHFGWAHTGHTDRKDTFYQEQNILYTLQAVKLAQRLGCTAFIGAGSQAEYGRVTDLIGPQTAVHPDIAYGVAKYAAGRLCGILCKKIGMRFIWTRIFSVYGPYDNSDTMIMYVIKTLLDGEKPTLTRGEQDWDYLYSRDAARAFYALGDRGKDQSVYCIGSGGTKKLSEYVKLLRDAINPELPLGVGEKEYAPDQVMHLCADISSLTKDTGFHVKNSFEEGIRETIEWYRRTRPKNSPNG